MEALEKMIGCVVKQVFFNEKYLKFVTDKGNFVFTVEGDCCSRSMFYDFYGVKNILAENVIMRIRDIKLNGDDIVEEESGQQDKKFGDEKIEVYGYKIILKSIKTDNMCTAVFSFRNYSNGYYGGWMEKAEDRLVKPEIFADVLETVEDN